METTKKLKNISSESINEPTKKIEKLNKNNNPYDNYNIKSKSLILKINCYKCLVNCLCMLDDGRLVSNLGELNNIIIYNKITYKQDLIIKEHFSWVLCIINLKFNKLASSSADKTIKIFKIQDNNYEILQIFNYHLDNVNKIIELKNKNLVSCSKDKSIIFYTKDNNDIYKKDYQIYINNYCGNIIQIKENEISYLEYNYDYRYNIYFYDFKERKNKSLMLEINNSGTLGPFNMITKNLLIIGGYNKISIINVNQYKLIKVIEITESSYAIYGFCMLNEYMFLTGSDNGIIRQWKIENDDINLIFQKEKTHEYGINAIMKLRNGKICTCSDDGSIKIW